MVIAMQLQTKFQLFLFFNYSQCIIYTFRSIHYKFCPLKIMENELQQASLC